MMQELSRRRNISFSSYYVYHLVSKKHGVYGFMWAGMCNKLTGTFFPIGNGLESLLHVPVSVSCWANFVFVLMKQRFFLQPPVLPSGREGLETSFATLGLCVGHKRVANVVDSEGMI